MMRLYEQGSSHRLKALGFRPNYVGGIFMKNHWQSVFTGTTASSTACRHGSIRRPRSQPTAEQFSPVGQTRFLRMWARPSCSKPEPPVSFGFLRP